MNDRLVRTSVTLVASLVLGACTATAQFGSSPSTQLSTSSVPPAATTPALTPTPSESPILTVPPSAIRSLAIGSPLAVEGSKVFVETGPPNGGTAGQVSTLQVGDLATGMITTVATLEAGRSIAALSATPDRLVWVETWRTGTATDCNGVVPCCPSQGKPLQWQVVGFDPTSQVRQVLASGTNTRIAVQEECADVNPPVLAADSDRVAYTLEATTPTAPFGNEIVVRSLAAGSIVRSVKTAGFVPWLGLTGTALVYRETLGAQLDGGTVQDARLMLATTDDQVPNLVDDHAWSAAVDQDALVWGRTDATDASIWSMAISTGVRIHVPGPATSAFQHEGDPGSWWVSVSGLHAAWVSSGSVNGGAQSAIPFLWIAGESTAQLVVLPTAIDGLFASDGWLIWEDDTGAAMHGVDVTSLGS